MRESSYGSEVHPVVRLPPCGLRPPRSIGGCGSRSFQRWTNPVYFSGYWSPPRRPAKGKRAWPPPPMTTTGHRRGLVRSSRIVLTRQPERRRSFAPSSARMIIVDTAPLVAAAISNDQDHDRCVEVFNRMHRERQTLVVPCFVVAETCYMIQRSGGNRTVALFMRSLVGGIFQQIDLDDQDTM